MGLKDRFVAKFRDHKAYAEGGMVHVVNEVTGEESHMSYRDFTKTRIKDHLMAMRDRANNPRERAEYQKAMDECLMVAFEARRQGAPLRPMSQAERQHAQRQAVERFNDTMSQDVKKIVTPADFRAISAKVHEGYTPMIVDEYGNRLV